MLERQPRGNRGVRVRRHEALGLRLLHCVEPFEHRARRPVLARLEICVHDVVERVQRLIPDRGFSQLRVIRLAGIRGRAVGVDRLLPETEAREDVRRHVLRVRHGRRDLRVAPRSAEPARGQGRIVIAVDDVVRDAGMVRLLGQDLLEDRARLQLIGVRLVGRRRRRVQRERIEHRGLAVVGIAPVELLHRLLVGGGPRAMVQLVVVAIVRLDRGDVVLLARRCGQPTRLLQGGRALLQHRRARGLPERVVDAHRHAPVAHRAGRILRRQLGEGLLRLLVPERVQERDRALEIGLDSGRTRDGEGDVAKFRPALGGRDGDSRESWLAFSGSISVSPEPSRCTR